MSSRRSTPLSPVRSPRATARIAVAALVAAIVAAAPGAALGAQPATTITFDEAGPPPGMVWQMVGTEYLASGYRIGCTQAQTGTICSSLAVIGTASPAAPGSPALFNNNLFGVTTIARTDGGAFDLLSIAASPFDAGLAGNLVFEAMLANGTIVSQTIALTGPVGSPVTYTFADQFRGVSWVRFGGDTDPIVAPVVDAITLRPASASVVPEPATVALLGGGLLALAGVGLVRRRA